MNTSVLKPAADKVESPVSLVHENTSYIAPLEISARREETAAETTYSSAAHDEMPPCMHARESSGAAFYPQSVDSEAWLYAVRRKRQARDNTVPAPGLRGASSPSIIGAGAPHHANATDELEQGGDRSSRMLEIFAVHRQMMFRIARRILGSTSDADDMLQELWLRWQKQDPERIQSTKAWLGSTMTRLCIDQLRSARRQREESYGICAPEAMISDVAPEPHDAADREHSVAAACAKIQEALRPVERVVFMLHEVLDYDYGAAAAIVGKDVANCRQILHRAKVHLRADAKTHSLSEWAYRLGKQIPIAAASGELTVLLRLLQGDHTPFAPEPASQGNL